MRLKTGQLANVLVPSTAAAKMRTMRCVDVSIVKRVRGFPMRRMLLTMEQMLRWNPCADTEHGSKVERCH
jgi:hypothetical protein